MLLLEAGSAPRGVLHPKVGSAQAQHPKGRKKISIIKLKAHLKQEKKSKNKNPRGQNKPSSAQDAKYILPRGKLSN